MRIVVFSDSHGNDAVLPEIIKNQPEAETFIFLGDGEREFINLREAYPDKIIRGVRGNCDWSSALPFMDLITVGHKRIMYTHGHLYYVKSDTERLLGEARNHRANVVLYGHTHVASSLYENGLHIMNPGSASQPRSGRATYGYIDINGSSIFTGIVTL